MRLAFISLLPCIISNDKYTKMIINTKKNILSNYFCKYDYQCQLPTTCIIFTAGYGLCGYDKRKKLIPIPLLIPIDR